MLDDSFFLVWRRFFDEAEPLFQAAVSREGGLDPALAWLWLLAKAAHSPHSKRVGFDSVQLERAEVLVSVRHLTKKFRWGGKSGLATGRAERFLRDMAQLNRIEKVRVTPHGTVYRITAYDDHQAPVRRDTHSTPNGTPDGTGKPSNDGKKSGSAGQGTGTPTSEIRDKINKRIKKNTDKRSGDRSAVEEVMTALNGSRSRMLGRPSRLTAPPGSPRERLIQKRLKDYGKEMLLQVIQGFERDTWRDRKNHMEPETIFAVSQDRHNIDRGVELFEKHGNRGSRNGQRPEQRSARDNLRELGVAV